jgi:predicted lactoylglutathione lyase
VSRAHALTAILPCNDLDASEAFYARLGFTHREGGDEYRMLSFAVSDPDETLLRVGWPTRLRRGG